MDLTLYTLGDIEIFKAALTATAMMFSADGSYVGEGGLGLGSLSALGLLVSLTVLLIQAGIKQKVEFSEWIVMIAIFVTIFVPKFRVQIEDYHDSGKVTAVDGVPMGIAFPAAMMSSIVKAMNDKASTIYATTEGGMYVNVMSPLKILNGFQRAGFAKNSLETNLGNSLRGYVAYCLAQRASFDEARLNTMSVGQNFINFLTTEQITPGFALWYTLGDKGTPLPCADIKELLNGKLNEFYETDFEKVINRAATSAIGTQGDAKSAKGKPISREDYEKSFQGLLGGNAELAKNYAMMMLYLPHVNGAIDCAPNIADPNAMRQCMGFAQILPGAAFDAAASGSYFQRFMIVGMNSLLFLWICLAPVVAMVILITGVRGIKIAGSYMLFGAWSQSWFVGAAIINFYIQKQIAYEMDIIGGVGNLTFDQFGQLANSLQIKITLASDMLASVPLIMMSVMSGSAYAMTRMSERWGAADKFDEKLSSAPLASGAAIASTQSDYSQTHSGALVNQNFGTGRTWDLSHANKWAQQSGTESQHKFEKKMMSGLSNVLSEAHKSGNREQELTSLGAMFGVTNSDDLKRILSSKNAAQSLIESANQSRETSFERGGVSGHLGGAAAGAVGGNTRGDPATKLTKEGNTFTPLNDDLNPAKYEKGPVSGKLGVDAGFRVEKAVGEANETSFSHGSRNTYGGSNEAGRDETTGSQTRDGTDWQKVQALASFVEHNFGSEFKQEFSADESQVKSFIEKGCRWRSFSAGIWRPR